MFRRETDPDVDGPPRPAVRVASHAGYPGSLGLREEQFIAVRVVDLKGLVPPPDFLDGNGAFAKITPKISVRLRGQRDEQAPSVRSRCILAQDDVADDTLILSATALALLAVALLACWLPARRAAKIDPMIALRAE